MASTNDSVCDLVTPEYYPDLTQNRVVLTVLTVVWVLMTLATLAGNCLVVLAVCLNHQLRTVTVNCYLVNMALADALTALFVMPLKLVELAAPCRISALIFRRASAACQVSQYLFMILVFTSLLSVVVISIERYIAVLHPFSARFCQSRSRTRAIIAVTWLIPMLVCLPLLFSQSVYSTRIFSERGTIDRALCQNNMPASLRQAYITSFIVLFYLAPLAIISFTSSRIIWRLLRPLESVLSPVSTSPGGARNTTAVTGTANSSCHNITTLHSTDNGTSFMSGVNSSTSRSISLYREENKRKVAKMITVIASLYFVSWTPFYVMQIVAMLSQTLNEGHYFFIFIIIHMMSFLNSLCNPIIYYFMSEKLRRAFIGILARLVRHCCCCCFCCKKSNIVTSWLMQHQIPSGYVYSQQPHNTQPPQLSCSKTSPSLVPSRLYRHHRHQPYGVPGANQLTTHAIISDKVTTTFIPLSGSNSTDQAEFV